MKQIKKSMLYLIPILLIILIPYKASANTDVNYNSNFSTGFYFSQVSGYYYDTTSLAKTQMANKSGNLIFTIYQAPVTAGAEYINEVKVISGNYEHECNIGQTSFYNDNNTQRAISTIICENVQFTSSGFSQIYMHRPNSSQALYVLFSQYATLTDSVEGGTSAIVNQVTQINNKTQDIYNLINGFKTRTNEQLVDIYYAITNSQTGTVTAINNQTTAITNELQDIEDTDISNESKQQPNQDNYDDVQDQEDVVYENLDDIDVNTLVDMNIDINTSNWIWNTITSILQANARVMAMVISVLSLGLCKFVLGR